MSKIEKYIEGHELFVTLMSLVSAGVGCFWGIWAQVLYKSSELHLFDNGVTNPEWVGGLLGGFFGLIVGVFYALQLARLVYDGIWGGHMVGKVVWWGVLAGVVCSSLVHGSLMLCYRNGHMGPILIGAIFGAFTGALLGLIFGGIFIAFCAKNRPPIKE